ncbi:MAG TPA: hypothetical protein VL337_12065 [Acidimicrobiales bacterium]|nr:hypothetical protein [Acidimicrobiales bacterium]
MNALVFLGIAAGLSLLGCGVLWLRHRTPQTMDAHIRDFARELEALAPEPPPPAPRPRRPPAPPGPRPRPPQGRPPG